MCSRNCLKNTVVFFNVLIMLIGAGCLALGIWIHVDDESFFDRTSDILDLEVLGDDLLNQVAIAMIVIGSSALGLAVMGCVGALSMCSYILVFYTLVLVLLLVVEVAILTLAIVFRSELLEKADDLLQDDFLSKYGDKNYAFTHNFDLLQEELDCCGWNDSKDYDKITDPNQWNKTINDTNLLRKVPDVCCQSSNETLVFECVQKPINNTIYSDEGCKDAVENKFNAYVWGVAGVIGGLLFFQFLMMVFSLMLVVQNVGKKYDMS